MTNLKKHSYIEGEGPLFETVPNSSDVGQEANLKLN